MSIRPKTRHAAAALAGAFALTAVTNAQRTYDARTFFQTTSIRGASFSHDDERVLYGADESGVFNLYAQPVVGGLPEQLTHSVDDAFNAVSYFPGDDRVLFGADEGGDELDHLYVRHTDGRVEDLTPGQGHRAGFGGWSGDLESFYVQTNERDERAMDLYRYDAATFERELVYRNESGFTPGRVSPDGRWLALSKVRNNADNDLYLLDLRDPEAEPRHVTQHRGDVRYRPQGFSHDGARLYYTCNVDSEFSRVWSYDIATCLHELEHESDWDIMFFRESFKGSYQVMGVNADARTEITVIETATDSPLLLPSMPRGDITGVTISRSERMMALYVNGDTAPSNLYVMRLEGGGPRQLTDALNGAIDPNDLVESEVLRYASFDGVEIPALLYRPQQASAEHPVPAMVWVHGGPGGQSRTGYSAYIQYLVNRGYAVLAVNNRGSSGYGTTFHHLDDRNHGEGDLQDCIHGRRYLETLGWVDGDRIGIIGGSYGGYMVAAALAFEPEAFEVGVDIFGVTNWLRTLQEIPPWWDDFKDALYAEMGDPATDEARLHRISPLFHAESINKPLLVVQGANDPRVKKIESDELVAAARRNGTPVEYVVFDDEGHGFSKKANRITALESISEFLDRYLRE